MTTDNVKVIARNRQARHDYEIIDTLEAGMILMGSEIKSIRAARINLREGYVQIDENGEVWLMNVHISTYDQASIYGHEPLRPRKLLLHKKEIVRLQRQVQVKGMTIIPLQVHLKQGRAKVELGIARGKK
ncbi:MAG TPA: SsrA-binding protein SmpB, partial [Aggregatilineales bacterium]|nr:SsrA-binding protein SmpB [Aggregatilineales bacterium]